MKKTLCFCMVLLCLLVDIWGNNRYNILRNILRGEFVHLNIMKIMNEPDSQLTVKEQLDISNFQVIPGIVSFPNRADVSLFLKNIMNCVTLKLHVEVAYHTVCDRCMSPVIIPVSFDFESIVKVDDDSVVSIDSDAVLIDSSNELDVKELVINLLLMNLPMKTLCKQDCKGLCPTCGADLNLGGCGCEKKQIDPRLEVLKKLLD